MGQEDHGGAGTVRMRGIVELGRNSDGENQAKRALLCLLLPGYQPRLCGPDAAG